MIELKDGFYWVATKDNPNTPQVAWRFNSQWWIAGIEEYQSDDTIAILSKKELKFNKTKV